MWKKFTITKEQIAHIEEATRAQADSTEWYQERNIETTASFFGRVCRRLPSTSPDALVNLIVNLIVNQKKYKSVPVPCAWGKNHELKALNSYITNMQANGHTCNGLNVEKSGVVINPAYSFNSGQ